MAKHLTPARIGRQECPLAIFARRRHQPSRPALAKIRPDGVILLLQPSAIMPASTPRDHGADEITDTKAGGKNPSCDDSKFGQRTTSHAPASPVINGYHSYHSACVVGCDTVNAPIRTNSRK